MTRTPMGIYGNIKKKKSEIEGLHVEISHVIVGRVARLRVFLGRSFSPKNPCSMDEIGIFDYPVRSDFLRLSGRWAL